MGRGYGIGFKGIIGIIRKRSRENNEYRDWKVMEVVRGFWGVFDYVRVYYFDIYIRGEIIGL